ncbi:tetratricopeptide repeat protein, partial [bacterium]|nr:tetratricopeptide repeat protein [bacterium]
MKRTVLATLLTIVLSAGILRAESVRTLNNEGVEAYERGDYQDAENLFDQAREKKPEDLRIQYNRGAALAGSDDLEGALDAFARVSGARDEEIARRADFSRGVAFLKQAQAKAGQQDMDGAIKSAQAAEEANKVVLLQTPQDEDARINFEIAHRLRKQLEEVRQQEQQQKDQQQENQQEDQQQQKQEQQEQYAQQDQHNAQ